MAQKIEGLGLRDSLQSLRYRTPDAMMPAAIYLAPPGATGASCFHPRR